MRTLREEDHHGLETDVGRKRRRRDLARGVRAIWPISQWRVRQIAKGDGGEPGGTKQQKEEEESQEITASALPSLTQRHSIDVNLFVRIHVVDEQRTYSVYSL